MKLEDLKSVRFCAKIYAKDLKNGMKIIDEDDCDKVDSITYIFDVCDVKVTSKKVLFRAIAYGEQNEIICDFNYTLYRKPEEPELIVFFSSIDEGIKFGIKEQDIHDA